uniref:uncharacterized protein LOC105351531 isoform X1 n=1 Tax=Fragaria vesca subsp. vesca TaxID=101020 RepID=UPI0005C82523|nr:PREDICTED: uncharacterized protein LOC105351531 isoform X1 [Fragaria vesca subsp. vesca]
MAADPSETLNQHLGSVSDDLQNLNKSRVSVQSKLDEKLRELVGPQIITIRQDVAIAKREKAELEEAVSELITRVEWMKNVMMQLSHLVASRVFCFVLTAISVRVRAGLKEDVNELRSTTEQPWGADGFGKDQIMKYFKIILELPPAMQRDLDEIEEAANELNQQPNCLGEMHLADKIMKVGMNILVLVPAVQRDLDKIQEVVKKQETRNEWIETMVKQLEEQVACIEGCQILKQV